MMKNKEIRFFNVSPTLAVVNIGFALFNLIPIPPLDGSKVVGELSVKVNKCHWKLRKYWRLILLVLLMTGVLSRPLIILNNGVFKGIWQIVRWLLHIGYESVAPISFI